MPGGGTELNSQADTMKESVSELLTLVGGLDKKMRWVQQSVEPTVPAWTSGNAHPASASRIELHAPARVRQPNQIQIEGGNDF